MVNSPRSNGTTAPCAICSTGNLPDDSRSLSIDVGVDAHAFRPWHFDELQAVMTARLVAREASALFGSEVSLGEDGRDGHATAPQETEESQDH